MHLHTYHAMAQAIIANLWEWRSRLNIWSISVRVLVGKVAVGLVLLRIILPVSLHHCSILTCNSHATDAMPLLTIGSFVKYNTSLSHLIPFETVNSSDQRSHRNWITNYYFLMINAF